jgi:hypothetical protein
LQREAILKSMGAAVFPAFLLLHFSCVCARVGPEKDDEFSARVNEVAGGPAVFWQCGCRAIETSHHN